MLSELTKSTQNFLNWYLSLKLIADGAEGIQTKTAKKQAILKIKEELLSKQYLWFDNKVNLIGFRLNKTYTDRLSDWFIVATNDDINVCPASTVAGSYYVYNPVSTGGITGTAILAEGQNIDAWQFVTKQDWSTLWLKTPYFQQIKPVKIYRDTNKNSIIDEINMPTQIGLFGINLHTAGLNYVVYNWSAGCQVNYKPCWLELLAKYNFKNGDYFSYTLINKS
jgi:hypothetical protein